MKTNSIKKAGRGRTVIFIMCVGHLPVQINRSFTIIKLKRSKAKGGRNGK